MRCSFVAVVLCFLFAVAAACGGPPIDDTPSPESCGIAPVVFDAQGDVLQAKDEIGRCVRIERTADPVDICIACPYTLHRLVFSTEDEHQDIGNDGRLHYDASHHNWGDTASADLDDGGRVQARILYVVDGDTWELELQRTDDAGQVQGPFTLTPEGLLP